MIQPNFNLFLWIILVLTTLSALSRIIVGCLKLPKDLTYNYIDAVYGAIEIILIVWVLLG